MLYNEKLKQNFTILKKEGLKNKKMLRFKLFIYIDDFRHVAKYYKDILILATECYCKEENYI